MSQSDQSDQSDQGDQRNQPDDELANAAQESASTPEATGGEGAREAAGAEEPAATEGEHEASTAAGSPATPGEAAGSAAAVTETSEATAATEPTTAAEPTIPGPAAAHVRREFHEPGEGSPRYADSAEAIPPTGSEESWSAAPHPGYAPDPALHFTTTRLLVGTLIGALLLAGGVVYTYRILINRSGNGNGSAPWTAAVEQNGAVVGGINAQNNGSAPKVALPADTTYGTSGGMAATAVSRAVASCRTAQATAIPLATVPATPAMIHAWAVHATPTVQSLRADAASLHSALTARNVGQVANAAYNLCAAYPGIAALPPMPDAAGSQSWSAAAAAYSLAATQALRGVSGNPDALYTAADNITLGDSHLDALSTRIATAI